MSRDTILMKSPVFKHLEAIAFVFSTEDASPEGIKAIFNGNKGWFKKLLKNPHINDEFRIIYYELTDDQTYLHDDLKDCFIF